MVAITINVPAENLEKMKALAERAGRSLDEVIGAIANDAIEYELGGDDIDPAWDAELLRRIESVRNGTAKTVPAEEVFAEIRARFAR
jgi:putative addiction module component (TIGR02574 family)